MLEICECEILKERNDLGKTDINSRTLNGYYLNHVKYEGTEWINLN